MPKLVNQAFGYLLIVKVITSTIETPRPQGVEPLLWSIVVDLISRRGERMIPWVSGTKGSWSLDDHFEEIYLDEYSREQATSCPKSADS